SVPAPGPATGPTGPAEPSPARSAGPARANRCRWPPSRRGSVGGGGADHPDHHDDEDEVEDHQHDPDDAEDGRHHAEDLADVDVALVGVTGAGGGHLL